MEQNGEASKNKAWGFLMFLITKHLLILIIYYKHTPEEREKGVLFPS